MLAIKKLRNDDFDMMKNIHAGKFQILLNINNAALLLR